MSKNEEDEEKSRPQPKQMFEEMVGHYLAVNTSSQSHGELEVRFGTKGATITKMDYENTIRHLQSIGFHTTNSDGISMLRIHSEYMNHQRSETQMSNIRAEIVGLDLVQEYCRTNSIQRLLDLPSTSSAIRDKIKFTQKSTPAVNGGKPIKPVDFPDFNFRVSYQMEKDYSTKTEIAQRIIREWGDSRKNFRYINRVRFEHPEYPIFADVSIVKGSAKHGDVPIPRHTIQEAKVFSNAEHYEIELELDNSRIGPGTKFAEKTVLLDAIRKCIRFVLSSLQGTNYPIANAEKSRILGEYIAIIHGKEYSEKKVERWMRAKSREALEATKRDMLRHFIGPSSLTLQVENLHPQEDTNVPSILEHYTVTDKADGERRLLYVASNKRIYLIDGNMNIIFTGAATRDVKLVGSLLDGEMIKYDKNGKYVNIFAAFDIYYFHGKSVRELDFVFTKSGTEEDEDTEPPAEFDRIKYRLDLLQRFLYELKPTNILNVDGGNSDPTQASKRTDHLCEITIIAKTFYKTSSDEDIFKGCASILSKVRDGTYPYNTDGLIFTPSNKGVASERQGSAGSLYKTTWTQSFKWKPVEFNTIDFLVSAKKDKKGRDEIHHVFQGGVSMSGGQNLMQYKTLILMCGFDERKHGYLNPMLDMIEDRLPTVGDVDNEETYKPVPFQPTDPYDPMACICNVELQQRPSGHVIVAEENAEVFEENMIVEFRYDVTKEAGWRWIPLRVRYDKTAELRSGVKNYGNAYHVANGNWHSLHHPITEEMLTTGRDIPEAAANEDVYYNKSTSKTSTRALRDFHNLFVKRKLIMGVSDRGANLIDYSVGKAGDLPKWVAAKLGFVFGIDISKDNIENRMDGACARYLNYRKKEKRMPAALFVNGNTALNIRSGKAGFSEKDRQIMQAVFGAGKKDKEELGEGVYKQYGVGTGEKGFAVSSCQFSLHYFFENKKTLNGFLRNLAECTAFGGHFIGTCYDGDTVFQLLSKKSRGEGIVITQDGAKMFELTKQYDATGYPDDDLSLGYAIDVFQESINKTFREYLVNFSYFRRMMENYGFAILTPEEAKAMHMPSGTGLFRELFDGMMGEVSRDRRLKTEYGTAAAMTKEEKQVSFMNRYFIFRKTHNVVTEKVERLMLIGKHGDEEEEEELSKARVEKKVVIRRLPGKKTKVILQSVADTKVSVSVSIGKTVSFIRRRKE
jgi:hypothetical protein